MKPMPMIHAPRWRWEMPILVTGLVFAIASGVVAYRVGGPYGERLHEDPRVRRVFDEKTGRLELVKYDASGNLRFDMWSYMDAERVVRIEYDDNEDGLMDYWEYLRADQSTDRLDADTDGDGQPDHRTLFAPDGSITADFNLDGRSDSVGSDANRPIPAPTEERP